MNPTPNVTFAYDPYFSRIVSMTDGVGTTTYSYNSSFVDGAQQLARECFTSAGAASCSHTIAYGYDALGRSARRQISGSGAETWAYDAIGRITNHSSDLGAFQLSYLGQTQQLTVRQLLPVTSTLKTTWSYLDNAHDRRLAGIANTGLSSGQFTNFTFDTTPENFITGVTQTSDATVAEPSPSSQTVAFNNTNAITTVSGQSYSYDANGNLLSDGQRTYSWDGDNRLININYTAQPGRKTTFAYDGLGRRIETDDTTSGGGNNGFSKYVWCGSNLCQKRDTTYSIARDYFREGEYDIGSANSAEYYGIDQLASIRRVFVSSTNAPSYDYDPWGQMIQSGGSVADFGFARLVLQNEAGMWLANARAYTPQSARWLSRDMAGEMASRDANLYAYADEEPINHLDPIGLWTIQVGLTANYSASRAGGVAFGGIAFDSSGGAAFYYGVGQGGAIGAGASFGLSGAVSNANCVSDLGGPFYNASRGGGWGENLTGDGFYGTDSNGRNIWGAGASYGIGAGSTAFVGMTDTGLYFLQ